jgi:ubiquinol-cytochrome c reductase cytochrome b subunit
MFTILLMLPFIEAWITGDKREHHLLERPRNQPTRTALMVALMTFYGLMWAAGGNDIIAIKMRLSINQITYFMRAAVFIGPVIAFMITRRWCISLQRHDNEKLLHGYESGVIMRDAQGGYTEKHLPLAADRAYALTARNRDEVFVPASEADGNGVASPTARKDRLRAKLSAYWYGSNIQKPTREELAAAHHHAELEQAHDAVLGGQRADGHQFDGRHGVSGDELSSKH